MAQFVTFHAKTYTNGFVFNGLSRWQPVESFHEAVGGVGKAVMFFSLPVGGVEEGCWKLFSKPLEVLENSRLNNSFDPLE